MSKNKLEHRPHIGSQFEAGIQGKKVAVMGYSHHSDDPDHEEFTTDCIRKVESGEWADIAFFKQIAGYFGSDHKKFWSSVAFLNFLPRKVGESGDRFAYGTKEETADAQTRAKTFLEEYKPDYLFVFSRKAWSGLSKTMEEEQGGSGVKVVPGELFERHHYKLSDGHHVQAIGLRHPQGARKDLMGEAVRSGLSLTPKPPA